MTSITEDNDKNDQHPGGSSGEIMTSNKKECTSREQNNVDAITEGINSMAILDNISTCANCGKEGDSDDMNTCNKCKMVKYCNAACKKKHRTKHKKKCERRVAELHDEQLFKDHPPNEECPICFLPLPHESNTSNFMTCCGKSICLGCIYEMEMSEEEGDLCPFCRAPDAKTDDEHIKRTKKLMDKGDAGAFNHLAGYYAQGIMGLPQDWNKANELHLKAGALGHAVAYYNLGCSYGFGFGVEVDMNKAVHYYELAAMGGNILARYNLGNREGTSGNHQRAFKHLIIATRAGHETSLNVVKQGFMKGVVTKDEYGSTLRAYHDRQKEMKSDAREAGAVARNLENPVM